MLSSRKRSGLVAIVFLLVLVAALHAASVVFTRVSAFDFLRQYDYFNAKNSDEIDYAFIGNSTCYYGIDPNEIDHLLNSRSCMLATASARDYAFLNMTKEVLTQCQPKTVVVCYEYVFDRGMVVSNYNTAQYLSSPLQKAWYVLTDAKSCENYFDCLFPWRFQPVRNKTDAERVLQRLFDPLSLYEALSVKRNDDKTNHVTKYYVPGGHVSAIGEGNWEINKLNGKASSKTFAVTFENYKKLADMCQEKGTRLIIIKVPEHDIQKLGKKEYYDSTEKMNAFCEDYGIEFYNFDYIKDCYMPNLSDYMYDFNHLKEDGSKIFTHTLADCLKEITAGRDISDRFLTRAEWMEDVDYITNTWIVDKSEKGNSNAVYEADCNRGSLVVPEYRFTLTADGIEQIVQDWSENNRYTTEKGALKDAVLRVYARPQGAAADNIVHYDFS